MSKQRFMQDGDTPHTANATLELFKQKFADRVISRKTNYLWAPHFPDRNPLTSFFGRYAKDCIPQTRTLHELKPAILRFIKAMPADMCERVIGSLAVGLNECLHGKGEHIEHVLRIISVLKPKN